jgi:hypothetical protein
VRGTRLREWNDRSATLTLQWNPQALPAVREPVRELLDRNVALASKLQFLLARPMKKKGEKKRSPQAHKACEGSGLRIRKPAGRATQRDAQKIATTGGTVKDHSVGAGTSVRDTAREAVGRRKKSGGAKRAWEGAGQTDVTGIGRTQDHAQRIRRPGTRHNVGKFS